MRFNILVVNGQERERAEWMRMLQRAGYHIAGEAADLSGMVQKLSHSSVHIAMCSSKLPHSYMRL